MSLGVAGTGDKTGMMDKYSCGGDMARGSFSRFPRMEAMTVIACVLSSVFLLVTGFSGVWIHDSTTRGYMVLVHVSAGAIFSGSLATWAVLWADACRFDHPREAVETCATNSMTSGTGLPIKLCFWMFILSGLGLIMTAILALLEWVGTEGQQDLMKVHRFFAYISTLCICLLFLHRYLIVKINRGSRIT